MNNKNDNNLDESSKLINTKEDNSNLSVGSKRTRTIAIFSEYEQEKPKEMELENSSLEDPSATSDNTGINRERKKVKHFEEQDESSLSSQGTPSSLPLKSPSLHSSKKTKHSNLENNQTTSISSIPSSISSIPLLQSISSTSLSFLETLTSTNPDQIEASLCKVLSEQKRQLEEKLRAINSDLEKITSRLKEKENLQAKPRKKITLKLNDTPPKEGISDSMTISDEYSPTAPKTPKSKKIKTTKKKTNKHEVSLVSNVTPKASQRSKRSSKHVEEPDNGVVLSPVLLSCQKVLNSLFRHKYSHPFLEPVDPVFLGIPDYFRIIKHPMDLGTIKKKLLAGNYSTAKEFSTDVFLVFDNACTYNHPGSDVYIMSETLKDFFIRKLPSIKEKVIYDHTVHNNNNNININTNHNLTYSENQKPVNVNHDSVKEDSMIGDSNKSLNNTITNNNNNINNNNNENLIEATDHSGKENNIIIIKKKPTPKIEEIAWTREDKLRLSGNISKLNEKNLHDIFQIIKNSTYVDANEKEVVFDLDSLDHRTLNELNQYITKVNSKKKTPKKPNRSHHPSSSSSSSSNLPAHSHSSLPTSPIQSPPNLIVVDDPSHSHEPPKKSSILPEDIPQIVKPATHTKIEIENVSWMSLGSEKDSTNSEEIRTSSESLWSEFQNKDFLNKQKEKEKREREERLKREREEKEEERRKEEERILKEKENEQLRLEMEKEEARKRVEKELEELRQKEIEERERAKKKTSIDDEEEDIEQFVGSMESYGNLELQPITFNRTN